MPKVLSQASARNKEERVRASGIIRAGRRRGYEDYDEDPRRWRNSRINDPSIGDKDDDEDSWQSRDRERETGRVRASGIIRADRRRGHEGRNSRINDPSSGDEEDYEDSWKQPRDREQVPWAYPPSGRARDNY
ncbi:unnamed protein product [Cylicostephanus goldi]|uniref:Uncharacterized protein n=1 Tax=Cylicostephanus goldi TaxID=71465 RepID=A0A3P6R9T1_CYLGO|nr:unnamed protein product [Cylicostephanus goldi]